MPQSERRSKRVGTQWAVDARNSLEFDFFLFQNVRLPQNTLRLRFLLRVRCLWNASPSASTHLCSQGKHSRAEASEAPQQAKKKRKTAKEETEDIAQSSQVKEEAKDTQAEVEEQDTAAHTHAHPSKKRAHTNKADAHSRNKVVRAASLSSASCTLKQETDMQIGKLRPLLGAHVRCVRACACVCLETSVLVCIPRMG